MKTVNDFIDKNDLLPQTANFKDVFRETDPESSQNEPSELVLDGIVDHTLRGQRADNDGFEKHPEDGEAPQSRVVTVNRF